MATYRVVRTRRKTRYRWGPIIDRARDIVNAHGTMMTARQVFYRLVAEGVIENKRDHYNQVCRLSAAARLDGTFPRLLDEGRGVRRPRSFRGPDDARSWLRRQYQLERTKGQPWNIYVAAEKSTMVEQLRTWFSDRGFGVFALRGYSGTELVIDVREEIDSDGRPAVLLYAGDLDPSGEDIDDDFECRVDRFDKVERVALTAQQVRGYKLPPQIGKADDPRADAFIGRHGRLVQVELEALDPDDLHDLYEGALAQYWDDGAYRKVIDRERRDRSKL